MMNFRPAVAADICGIMQVISDGQRFIREQGFLQWTNGYPSRETLLSDIAAGNAYVLAEDDTVAAVAVAIEGSEPTYESIYFGEWGDSAPYITIHRGGVAHSYRNRGCGQALIAGVEGVCRDANIGYIRADTHRDNLPMRGLLERCGFVYRGVIYLADGQERVAYDKRIR